MSGICANNRRANRVSKADRPAYKQLVPADNRDGQVHNISALPDNRPEEAGAEPGR